MDQHNIDNKKLARLADYLAGDLPATEARQLQKELATDKALAQQLELMKKLKSQHQFQEKEARLRKALEAPGRKHFREKNSPDTFRRRILFAIAATVALLLVSWFLVKDSDAVSSLAAEYLEPPPSLSAFRSGETLKTEDQEQQIIRFYEAGEFKKALGIMEGLQSRFDTDNSSEFYFDLGILQLFANHPSDALKSFQNVKTGHTFDLQWYRAWALLFAKKKAEAKAIFMDLASRPNPFQNDAQQLLEELP